MAKKVIESVQDERDANMYEFAFHLVPKMTEVEALASFADIKKLVEASGATIKNESTPALLNLAYQMELTVESVKQKYNQAYFAWFILEATGIQILSVTEELKHRTDIIRHLIITTKNESPIMASEVAKSLSKEEDLVVTEDVIEEVVEDAEAVVEEISPEEVSEDEKKVDDAIDKLVV